MDSSSHTQRQKQPAPWQQYMERETELSQRSLRSTQPPADGTVSPFLTSLTPFQSKFHEIDSLKKTALGVMARFHNVQLEYTDWFKRQLKSFVELIKSLQISHRQLVPQTIKTLSDFRTIFKIAHEMSKNSKLMPQFEKFETFLSFWVKLQHLLEDLWKEVIQPLNAFCASVNRLRQPEVKRQIDFLYSSLTHSSNEDFDFTSCHNEKDHLFTYSLMTSDQDFLGLVGYIPYLISFATKICYLTTHIHLEKL